MTNRDLETSPRDLQWSTHTFPSITHGSKIFLFQSCASSSCVSLSLSGIWEGGFSKLGRKKSIRNYFFIPFFVERHNFHPKKINYGREKLKKLDRQFILLNYFVRFFVPIVCQVTWRNFIFITVVSHTNHTQKKKNDKLRQISITTLHISISLSTLAEQQQQWPQKMNQPLNS